MGVNIVKVRAHVAVHLDLSGSVSAETIKAGCYKVVTSFEIESPDDAAKVASVVKNAKKGCWVRAALLQPVTLEESISLNGNSLALDNTIQYVS